MGCQKWHTYVLTFFSLISDGLGSVQNIFHFAIIASQDVLDVQRNKKVQEIMELVLWGFSRKNILFLKNYKCNNLNQNKSYND